MGYVRPLAAILAVQVVIAAIFIALVATENVPFVDYDSDAAPATASAKVDRFDSRAAWKLLREQVELGPRPAGSHASRKLAARLLKLMPHGRYQGVPGGLRNVVGSVKGRSRRYVVVGAHYDTKEVPGFVGANDGASGTAIVTQLARQFARAKKRPRHTLVFVLFDGEESPGAADGDETSFERNGLRGSKVAARRWRKAEAMVLLDFVGDKHLSTPREANSSRRLWGKLRAAARRVGVGRHFPDATYGAVSDDHVPFIRRGVPSVDLIDFGFPCWHRTCDDLSAVSERSLNVSGEAVRELVASL
jgi:glutaminyl-peptide cyclotransferase